jgi:hypothetical protein
MSQAMFTHIDLVRHALTIRDVKRALLSAGRRQCCLKEKEFETLVARVSGLGAFLDQMIDVSDNRGGYK